MIAIDQLPGWAFSFALGMTAAWGYVKARETRTREQLERLAVAIAPVALWAMALSVYLFGIKAQQSQGLIAPSFGRASPWVQMLYSVTLTALMSMVLIGPGAWRKPFVARPISSAWRAQLRCVPHPHFRGHIPWAGGLSHPPERLLHIHGSFLCGDDGGAHSSSQRFHFVSWSGPHGAGRASNSASDQTIAARRRAVEPSDARAEGLRDCRRTRPGIAARTSRRSDR